MSDMIGTILGVITSLTIKLYSTTEHKYQSVFPPAQFYPQSSPRLWHLPYLDKPLLHSQSILWTRKDLMRRLLRTLSFVLFLNRFTESMTPTWCINMGNNAMNNTASIFALFKNRIGNMNELVVVSHPRLGRSRQEQK